jgi:hypothetical protein
MALKIERFHPFLEDLRELLISLSLDERTILILILKKTITNFQEIKIKNAIKKEEKGLANKIKIARKFGLSTIQWKSDNNIPIL